MSFNELESNPAYYKPPAVTNNHIQIASNLQRMETLQRTMRQTISKIRISPNNIQELRAQLRSHRHQAKDLHGEIQQALKTSDSRSNEVQILKQRFASLETNLKTIYQDAIAIENQGLNEAKHRQTISASNPAQIVTYQQQEHLEERMIAEYNKELAELEPELRALVELTKDVQTIVYTHTPMITDIEKNVYVSEQNAAKAVPELRDAEESACEHRKCIFITVGVVLIILIVVAIVVAVKLTQ